MYIVYIVCTIYTVKSWFVAAFCEVMAEQTAARYGRVDTDSAATALAITIPLAIIASVLIMTTAWWTSPKRTIAPPPNRWLEVTEINRRLEDAGR
jgi:Na+-driven multidrug efflux pump